MDIRWIAAGATLMFVGCAHGLPQAESEKVAPATVSGIATMGSDGQLCLQLRFEGPGDAVGDSYQCYKTDDPKYEMVRDRVGPIAVGEEKILPSFK